MRILAILYCYPPLLVPAAMCYMKLMAGLRASGVDVEIVVIAPETFDSPGPIPLDPTLADVAPEGIVQHVVRSPETSWWVRAVKRLDESRRFSYRWLEPRKREWTVPAARHLRSLDLSRFDAVLTCSQPHANHLLGLQLQERSGLPWIAYFSDPWTENPYASYASPRIRAHHRKLEDQVLARADLVLFTCEEMLGLVVDHHDVLDRERCGILPHAFVSDWYQGRQTNPPTVPPGRVRLLHTGSFYGPRTPLPLMEALQRVARDETLVGRLRVDSFGGMERRYRDQITAAGLGDVLRVQGFIPYLQTLSMMKQVDALLLVDAPLTSTEQSVFLPSKLIDYLGSHTPVVAVTPGQGATARVVRDCGGTVCALERPQELDDFLRGILGNGGIASTPRTDVIGQFDHRTVGRALAERIRERVG